MTNTNGTFTFEKDGTSWKLKEDPTFELNQDTVTAKTTTISGIAAASTIDTPDALADYGLDKPTVTLTVTRTDGGSYTLLFGSENTAASVYYMMYQGKEDKVYTVYAVTEQTFEFQESDLAPASDASTSGSAAAVTASSAEAATSAAASAATSAGAETSSSDAAASAAE
ncbi:MAG: DUF4340 domain-containing protein [Lachnospiraceae bacterium]|nr:DUF4340 domain-containing protein [Lachnospiraceae bacterium]